jgi:hypothetical protein
MNPRYPQVSERASRRCEYCRAPEAVFNFGFQVEHIHPQSLGGGDGLENLALACSACNLFKTNVISGWDEGTEQEHLLFNPRIHRWHEHFRFDAETCQICGITPIGRVTVSQLQFNRERHVTARHRWITLGLFP